MTQHSDFKQAILALTGKWKPLDNFYMRPFMYRGLVWKSAEHAYQSQKTRSNELSDLIHSAEDPYEAKRLGRKAKVRCDWERVKDEVMLDVLRAKFFHTELGKKLLETGDRYILHGNRHDDVYWGVVFSMDRKSFGGKNRLGEILMQVRSEVQRKPRLF